MAGGESGAGHALAEAALLEEGLFQMAELLVEEVVGLVDQTDGDVGDGLRWTGFDELAVKFVALGLFAAKTADILCLARVLVPDRVVANSQEIAVVGEQFFETGTANAGEFDFGFLGK